MRRMLWTFFLLHGQWSHCSAGVIIIWWWSHVFLLSVSIANGTHTRESATILGYWSMTMMMMIRDILLLRFVYRNKRRLIRMTLLCWVLTDYKAMKRWNECVIYSKNVLKFSSQKNKKFLMQHTKIQYTNFPISLPSASFLQYHSFIHLLRYSFLMYRFVLSSK